MAAAGRSCGTARPRTRTSASSCSRTSSPRPGPRPLVVLNGGNPSEQPSTPPSPRSPFSPASVIRNARARSPARARPVGDRAAPARCLGSSRPPHRDRAVADSRGGARAITAPARRPRSGRASPRPLPAPPRRSLSSCGSRCPRQTDRVDDRGLPRYQQPQRQAVAKRATCALRWTAALPVDQYDSGRYARSRSLITDRHREVPRRTAYSKHWRPSCAHS